MADTEVTTKRRGRPRLIESADGAGSAVLSARIRTETRKSLELEAARSGRSISQVADAWLSEGAASRSSLEAMLGGIGVAAVMKRMIEVAHRIQAEIGDPMNHPAAYHALSAAFDGLSSTIPTDSQRRIDDARVNFKMACARFLFDADEVSACGEPVDVAPMLDVVNGSGTTVSTARRKVRDTLNRLLADGPAALSQPASDLLEALDAYNDQLESFVKEALASRVRGDEMLRQSVAWSEPSAAADSLADIYRRIDERAD